MARRLVGILAAVVLALPWLVPAGCKSSASAPGATPGAGGSGGSMPTPPPPPAPVPAADFCGRLAVIACQADDDCCDGATVETPPVLGTGGGAGAGTGGTGGGGTTGAGGATATGSTASAGGATATGGASGPGGAGGATGAGGGAGGAGGSDSPSARMAVCVANQTVACDATVGKLVTDPRTGYDPVLGGAFLAAVRTAAAGCWKATPSYVNLLAVLRGTGPAGADCTPEDTTPASLRVAELSCEHGTTCRVDLLADGQPSGTCAARADSSCSHAFDCPAGQWCDQPSAWMPGVWGVCQPLRADGWGCSSDLTCASYSCAFDGTCGPAEEGSFCLTRFYATAVKADGPLGYWRLGDTMGSVAVDASGNHRDGRRAGGLHPVEPGALVGDVNPATSFDGTDAEITLSSFLAGRAALSLEAWVDTSAMSAGEPVLSFGDAASGGVTVSVGAAGDAIGVDFADTSGQSHPLTSGAATVTAGTWAHVVATYDGSQGDLYLNGVLVAQLAGVFTPRTAGAFAMGASSFEPRFFQGAIDEVALYGAALTPYQVDDHHRIGANGPKAATWRFFTWFQ